MLKLHGAITALATPFVNGTVDEKAFEKLVAWQIEEGIHGVVVCGTTGESPTLTEAEQDRLLQIAINVANKRIPIIMGTGSNSTAHTIHRTQAAQKLGADAALIVSPYYNKPVQEGLYQHFKAVHDATHIPIIVYNIPGRCVVDILPATMQKIAALPRVIGVKDATGDLTRALRTRADCGADFIQLSGDDGSAGAFLGQGGHGCISVASNVAPRICAEMFNAWDKGDMQTFAARRDALNALNVALFMETSPSPVKYGLSLLGIGSEEMRLPMVPCQNAATRQAMESAMRGLGLLGDGRQAKRA